ncbi:MAG TPA: hypothetical protein ENJ13_01935 [Chromatiales bacterium]|nr:hypothetical protein [Chromatiales bacterium]
MQHFTKKFLLMTLFYAITGGASAFTITIDGDDGTPGENVRSSNCQQSNEESFTSDSGGTFYTTEESYSGGKSLELNITKGSLGFGQLGGIINFPDCAHVGGKRLVKGDEIWVRLRIKFPSGFEFNQNGRNKFLRLRTFHLDGATKVSEGYNDLYIDGPPGTELWKPGGYAPFQFIFEGAQKWYRINSDFFTMGKWNTIEYHLRLDDKTGPEGGNSMVRVWLNGNLIGETDERRTLQRADSFIESLYLFTYWDNEGAHISQKLWIDDLKITTDTPLTKDLNGNPFIGPGDPPPCPPKFGLDNQLEETECK